MANPFSTIQVTVENKPIQVDYIPDSRIIIHDSPVERHHDTPEELTRHQSTLMMGFQEKVASCMRATTKESGLIPPFKTGQYGVQVELRSSRSTEELKLLDVLKSVMDGLNKEIVWNDQAITRCEISYTFAEETAANLPPDYLTVRLLEILSVGSKPIVEFASPIFVIPKEAPLVYDWNETLFDRGYYYTGPLEAALMPIMRIPVQSEYNVTMTFSGTRTATQDVDNLALSYMKLLKQIGVPHEKIQKLTLAKELSDPDFEFVDIRVF